MSLFRPPASARRNAEAQGESPFWISFADLMTALMVLFLVALTVALFSVTEEVSEVEQQKEKREREISAFLASLQQLAANYPGVSVRGSVIDFGERARFPSNSHRLDETQIRLLRDFAPQVLELARSPLGSRWLKRIAVVGFADARGNYLYNLNLSLQRSERVLCALLVPTAGSDGLSDEQRQQIRQLFMVSGASFNALKNTPEESRRIELRLEFFQADETPQPPLMPPGDADKHCPLDAP